jgi:hypothetical protein
LGEEKITFGGKNVKKGREKGGKCKRRGINRKMGNKRVNCVNAK